MSWVFFVGIMSALGALITILWLIAKHFSDHHLQIYLRDVRISDLEKGLTYSCKLLRNAADVILHEGVDESEDAYIRECLTHFERLATSRKTES